MKKRTALTLTRGGMIAALYVALTYASAIVGLSSGAIQLRLSEMLTVLPAFLPEAIPGLYLGCLIANLLTTLEPHTPEVWAYAAWNLAYNISVMMPTKDDRWRWVESAMKLLRDDGLRLNPRSPELHRELAWLFLSKVGGNIDEASPLYSKRWAEIVDATGGDWSQLKMNPSLVSYIDQTYGVQNWRDPKASALYWAHHGLSLKPTGAVRAELRQVLYQTLMLEAVEDARFAPKALQAMREAYVEMPSQSLKDMILRFRARFSL